MALLIAFDDARRNQFRRETSSNDGRKAGALRTPFFGSRDNPDLPLATLNQHDPGRFSGTHFHRVDQFQVIVEGKGKIGRHDVAPFAVHFTRAYTPYGPVLADAGSGFTFFVLRACSDTGSLHLPEAQDQLNQVPDRQPWQITRHAVFPTLQSDTMAADVMLQMVPGIQDRQGLAAYTLSMKPHAKALAPDPSQGDGQYLVVVKGSLLHDDKEHKAWALVFVRAKESPFRLHAGTKGMEALVLNFPHGQPQTAASKNVRGTMGSTHRQCRLCAFVYDEAAGLPTEGIAPGTRWQDIPETWSCPDCNASKSDFQTIEL